MSLIGLETVSDFSRLYSRILCGRLTSHSVYSSRGKKAKKMEIEALFLIRFLLRRSFP